MLPATLAPYLTIIDGRLSTLCKKGEIGQTGLVGDRTKNPLIGLPFSFRYISVSSSLLVQLLCILLQSMRILSRDLLNRPYRIPLHQYHRMRAREEPNSPSLLPHTYTYL